MTDEETASAVIEVRWPEQTSQAKRDRLTKISCRRSICGRLGGRGRNLSS
jgi:hypothetical protein